MSLAYCFEFHKGIEIIKNLNAAGHEAYFVGGCVRDYVLNRNCKDIDIATSALPEEVQALYPKADFVGAKFGVNKLYFADGGQIDISTYRTEGSYSDSRRPDSVRFTKNVAEDLARRDFTMNALLMDINGNIHDRVGGGFDIANGVIRTVNQPLNRFEEDALRMLRAVRFSAQLGFEIETDTLHAIQATSPNINEISGERINEELVKILTSGRAAAGIQTLFLTGLLEYVLPEVVAMIGVEQNPKHHPEGDVFTHTLGLLRQLPKDCSTTLALAALLHDIGKPKTFVVNDGKPTFYGHENVGASIARLILRRLKFSQEVIETVVVMIDQHMRFRVVEEMKRSKVLRFVRQDNFDELLELHRMDATAGSGNLTHHNFVQNFLNETPEEVLRPVKLVTGEDLLVLGCKPGPFFKEALEFVETEQLEGRVQTRDEAQNALRSYAEQHYMDEA
jgi:poly(A) polymerase